MIVRTSWSAGHTTSSCVDQLYTLPGNPEQKPRRVAMQNAPSRFSSAKKYSGTKMSQSGGRVVNAIAEVRKC